LSVTSRILDVGEYKAEVVSDRYNPLIGRRELVLRVDHPLKPTPTRLQLRFSIAKAFNTVLRGCTLEVLKQSMAWGFRGLKPTSTIALREL